MFESMRIKIGAAIFAALLVVALGGTTYAHENSAETAGAPPLSAKQKQDLQEILRLDKLASAGVAIRVAGVAKEIYANLLADHPNDDTHKALSAKLHRTAGELLTQHAKAMRQCLAVLTIEQRHYVRDQMGTPDMPADLLEVIVKIYELGK